jgi:hypothetical protein
LFRRRVLRFFPFLFLLKSYLFLKPASFSLFKNALIASF